MEGARKSLVPLLLLLAGCRGTADAPYPTYAPDPVPYVPNAGSGNAFDAYVLAAGEAEAAVASLKTDPLRRSFFTPQQREDLLRALSPAIRRIAQATGPCDFRYVPVRPGNPLPGRAAWRLLGRALRWRIDDALAAESPAAALDGAALALRFAGDLCGGGPADRTLGVEIAEDVRQALLPALPKLDVPELRRLANAVKSSLERRPSLDKTLANADSDMALALQTLMDGYREDRLQPIEEAMGREFTDLRSALKELKKKDGAKRAVFFDDLDKDRQRLAKAWRAAAGLPRAARDEALDVKLQGERPRRAFARHFFLVGKPLLDIEDRSVARQRLLIMEAELRRVVKIAGRAPATIRGAKPPWCLDPYNGRLFGYQPDGLEFRVYSVGANLKDDLGDTDAAGLDPDIRTVVP